MHFPYTTPNPMPSDSSNTPNNGLNDSSRSRTERRKEYQRQYEAAQRQRAQQEAQNVPLDRAVTQPSDIRNRVGTGSGSSEFDAQLGEALAAQAIKQVEMGVSAAWMKEAVDAVQAVASRQLSFTTDDVWAQLGEKAKEAREPRALGAVMRKAAKLQYCYATEMTTKTSRPQAHRRPLTMWLSKLYVSSVKTEEPASTPTGHSDIDAIDAIVNPPLTLSSFFQTGPRFA